MKFKQGEEVICNWGSGGAGFVKKGIIVSEARYNNCLKFDLKESEEACVVRFDSGEETWDGKPLGKNVVVPVREIRKRTVSE